MVALLPFNIQSGLPGQQQWQMDRIWQNFQAIAGAGTILQSNCIFLDGVTGNDATAVIGNPMLPFRSYAQVGAAVAAASVAVSPNFVCFVAPGTPSENITWASNTRNLTFEAAMMQSWNSIPSVTLVGNITNNAAIAGNLGYLCFKNFAYYPVAPAKYTDVAGASTTFYQCDLYHVVATVINGTANFVLCLNINAADFTIANAGAVNVCAGHFEQQIGTYAYVGTGYLATYYLPTLLNCTANGDMAWDNMTTGHIDSVSHKYPMARVSNPLDHTAWNDLGATVGNIATGIVIPEGSIVQGWKIVWDEAPRSAGADATLAIQAGVLGADLDRISQATAYVADLIAGPAGFGGIQVPTNPGDPGIGDLVAPAGGMAIGLTGTVNVDFGNFVAAGASGICRIWVYYTNWNTGL